MCYGQFLSRGSTKCFLAAPFWKGIGFSMIIVSICLANYYSVVIAWVVRYLFSSFRSELVWHKCSNSWNTDACIDRDSIIGNLTYSIKNNMSIIYCSKDFEIPGCVKGVAPTAEFFEIEVLNSSSSFENFGTPKWDLALCSLLTWTIVALCILFGIRGVGKVVYVTAILPYVILIVLLIRSVTLDGAIDGIKFYITPNFEKLKEVKVWYAAGEQVFFSLGLACGQIMMYSSYNKFSNNLMRDAIVLTCVDCLTSFLAGFAVFGIIGFIAKVTKSGVNNVLAGGTGLAFITYPEAASNLPVGPIWAVLFFLMLFTLGIDSLFSQIENAMTGIGDCFPQFSRFKPLISVIVCSIMFLSTLPLVCPGGLYPFESIAGIATVQSYFILGLLELVVYMYIYGVNNVFLDIKMMLKRRPLEPYLFITWVIIAPIVIFLILILSYLNFEFPTVNGIPIPSSIAVLGWTLLAITMLPILIGMIHEVYTAVKYKKVVTEKDTPYYMSLMKFVNKPSPEWGPAKEEDRIGRYEVSNDEEKKGSIVLDQIRF